jgi:HSP20 family molecular chaperone IbpA
MWASTAGAPDVDLYVKNSRLVARMDLPGMTGDEVSVDVGDGEVTIRGTRPPGISEPLDRCACEHRSFFRTIPLPDGVTREAVSVRFVNGILQVTIAMDRRPASAPPAQVEEPVLHY